MKKQFSSIILWSLFIFSALYDGAINAAEGPADEPQRQLLLTHEQSDFLLSYNGEILADVQQLAQELARRVPITYSWAEYATLHGHNGSVYFIALSPDGKKLASNSADNTIRIWDLDAPVREPIILYRHNGECDDLTFSPDGQMLGCSTLHDVYLWDTNNLNQPNQEPRRLQIPGDENGHSLAFSPDGQLLVCGNSCNICIWHTQNFDQEPLIIPCPNDFRVLHVAFSPNGQVLAVGTNSTIFLWNTTDFTQRLRVLQAHRDTITDMAWHDDNLLVSCSQDGTICKWTIGDQISSEELTPPITPVLSVACSPDGLLLASTLLDDCIRIWNMQQLTQEPRILHGHDNQINCLAFSRDSQLLVSGSSDRTIKLWRPLLLQQQLLVAKALFNPLLTNSVQRKNLQTIAYQLPADQQAVVLELMPLLKKEFDNTQFAQYFPTSPVSVDCLGKIIPLSAASLQHILPAVLIAQAHFGGVSDVLSLPVDFRIEHAMQAACINADDYSTLHLSREDQEYFLDACDKLLCAGNFGIIPIAHYAATYIKDHALAAFGLEFVGLLDSSCQQYSCWPLKHRPPFFVPSEFALLQEHVTRLFFSPQGRFLMGLSVPNTVVLWDVAQCKPICRALLPSFFVNEHTVAAWRADEAQCAICTDNSCKIVTWDHQDGNHEVREVRFPQPITYLVYYSDTVIGAFSQEAQQIYVYNNATDTITTLNIQSAVEGGGRATAMVLSPDKTLLAVGMEHGVINLVNPLTLAQVQAPLMRDSGSITALTFGNNNQILASYVSEDRTIRIWNVQTRDSIRTINSIVSFENPVLTMCVEEQMLSLSDTTISVVWNMHDGTCYDRRSFERFGVIDPTGTWYATVADESHITLQSAWRKLLTAEQYLLIQKALNKPEKFSDYLTPHQRAQLSGPHIAYTDHEQKQYLRIIYNQLSENLKNIVQRCMPWLFED